MRILIVDTYYPAFLDEHYRRRPGLARRPYEEQLRSLLDRSFGTSDAYSHYLRQLGHTATEVIANCAPLQAAWARERGARVSRLPLRSRRHTLVETQAESFAADVVYVQDMHLLPARTLEALRRRALLVGQIASEPPPAEQVRRFDLVVTSFPHYVERFRGLGVDSEYLRIGFDPRVLQRVEQPARRGAVFVGSLTRDQHGSGNAVLERAAERAPIEFWGREGDSWPESSPVRQRWHGEVWGIEMLRVLAGAIVAVNRHIDVAETFANNMRLYEATGVGALLVTDAKQNLAELFEPGREVVAYTDADELADAVLHYLAHPAEAAAIAAAGQRRTLSEHTYAHRMAELVGLLEPRLR
jgi:spore maturation protein CgeB